MKNKNQGFSRGIITTLLICGGVFFFCASAFAEWEMISKDLSDRAVVYYEEGNYRDAIHEFSKVLLMNPHNEKALKYLNKMGLKSGIYGGSRKALDQIYDLNQAILAYQKDLHALEDQNEAQQQYNKQLEEQKRQLRAVIEEKQEERARLLDAHEELRVAATMKIKEQDNYISELEDIKQGQAQELVEVNTDLFQMKEQVETDKDMISDQAEQLDTLKSDLQKNQQISEEQMRVLEIKHKNQLSKLEQQRNNLNNEIAEVKDNYRQRVRKYNKVLVDKQAELMMEKNLSTVKSYRIAQQENRYLELKKKLDFLYKEKQNLYNEEQALQTQIQKLRQEKAFRFTSSDKDESKKKLVDHIRRQDDIIIDLKSRLVGVLQEIDSLKEEDAAFNESRIQELEQQVAELDREINEKEKDLKFSKDQQRGLEERIKEYQERLDIVEGMIKDKEERILFLEEQLGADVYPDDEGEGNDGV